MDRHSRPKCSARPRKAAAGTARRIIAEDRPKGGQLMGGGYGREVRLETSCSHLRHECKGKTQKSVPCGCNQTMSGPGTTLEMPALGRPFRLGLLYDCFRDVLLSGCSLLDPETIQKNTEKIIHASHTMQKVPSGTIGEKAAALDIKPSLMTSILCGLPEVNGAAKYLFSTKKPRCQDKVTYHYLTTERAEQLRLDGWRMEDVAFPTVPSQYKPSHVVTAVWYGEQSVLDYDKEVSTLENVEKDIRNLLLLEGKTDLQLDEVGKPQNKTHNLTFHGDSAQENNPVTFQDAKLLGWSREKSVPVKVCLFPLENLMLGDPRVQNLRPSHEISETLNSSIKHTVEGLIEVETQCEDLLKDPSVKTFPEIRNKIQQFQGLCCQYKQAFQKKLAEIVPLVREGHRLEKDLEEVLECIRKSPFDTKGLCEFLDTKQREVTFLNSVLSILKDVEIVCPKKKLEEKFFDLRTDFVVAFLFTSLHQEEPYLSNLEDYVSHSLQLEDSGWESLSCPSWLEDKTLVTGTKEAAKSFSAFVRANPSSKTTQFVVASIPDDSDPGTFIHLYENGDLSGTRFEPPSKPLPVRIGAISPGGVQLSLTPGESGAGAICCFRVEHRVVGQENWEVEVTNGREEVVTVRGLSPDTEYEFRYAAVSKPGRSESSDVSSPVKTLARSPPPAPQEGDEGSPILAEENTTIRTDERNTCCAEEVKIIKGEGDINWNQPGTGREAENVEDRQAFTPNLLLDDSTLTGPSPKGEPRNVATSLLRTSLRMRSGHPSIYAVPLQKSVCKATSTYLKYSLGKEASRLHHKVIMLLGETGAGKSTLIDGMMNYLLGVQWEDDFRFKATQDVPKRTQAVSQTDTLTAYEINLSQGLRVPFSLTLIDTPGFGDTRGISYDKMLLEQIREFFLIREGFDHIDAVCMVVQASQPRLTQPQKYIFDSLLSIFGKDIQENIQVLITFADGQKPPVLEAIKAGNVPCARDAKGVPFYFPFNNSALFSSNVQAEGDSYLFNQMFWQMGVNSLDVFFRSLVRLEPRSLTTTAGVLDERKALEAILQGMKPQIKMALLKLEELRKTERALARHRGDVEANRNFEYELEKTVPFKIDISSTGYAITNCQRCHITCHYPCRIQDGREKWKCAVMDKRLGRCRICPGKCPWEDHFTQSYKWEYCVIKEKQTYAHLKEKYEKSCGKLMTEASACQWLSQECRKAEQDLVELVKKLSQHLRGLQKIALRTNSMTTSEYLDLMISSEEEELEAGYEERTDLLRYLKKQFSDPPTQAY